MNAKFARATEIVVASIFVGLVAWFTVAAAWYRTGSWLMILVVGVAYIFLLTWLLFRALKSKQQVRWNLISVCSLVLMCAVLVAVYMLGEQSGAEIVAGQPGDRIALALAFALIAAATGVIVTSTMSPPALRYCLAALGIYGMLGVGAAIAQQLTLGEAWSGSGYWSRLPVWFQGPLVGTYVVAIALVAILWGLVRHRTPLRWQFAAAYVVSLSALTMIFYYSTEIARTPQADNAPYVASEDLPPLEESVPHVSGDQIVDSILGIADRIPPEDYDIEALAARLGDPEDCVQFVRDNIDLEPYSGSLRGAQGTLNARAGNTIDRSLLLQNLLKELGIESRLVFGEITQDESAVLRDRVLQSPVGKVVYDPALALAGISESAWQRMRARTERDQRTISIATQDIRSKIKPGDSAKIDRKQHVWVRARIDGEFRDFDTAFPGSVAVVGSYRGDLDDMSSRVDHGVTIRIVSEAINKAGTATETVLLDRRIDSPVAANSQVFVMFTPTDANRGAGGAILEIAGEETRYKPLIMADSDIAYGATLPPAGRIKSDAQEFFFGDSDEGTILAAIYVDVLVSSPDGRNELKRRTLLDRVAVSDRVAKSMSPDRLMDLKLLNGQPEVYAAIHQIVTSVGGAGTLQTAVGIASAVDFAGKNFSDESRFSDLSLAEVLWPIGEFNRSLAFAAERYSSQLVNVSDAVRYFVARPRVYIISLKPRTIGGDLQSVTEFDLIHDGIDWIADGSARETEVVDARLFYGVAQSALETTLAEVRYGESLFVRSASIDSHDRLRVFRKAEYVSLDVDVPMGIHSDLDSGKFVILSESTDKTPLQTWWALDQKNGHFSARLATEAFTNLGGSYVGGNRIPQPYYRGGSTPTRYPGGWDVSNDPSNPYRTSNSNRAARYSQYKNAPKSSCRGGTEYQVILGCVSIPAGFTVGWAYTFITLEVVNMAALVIASMNELS